MCLLHVQHKHSLYCTCHSTQLLVDGRQKNNVSVTWPCMSQEMNEQDERTRFLQIWMTPDRRGHRPQYGSSKYSKADRHNKLLHILGGTGTMPSWETATAGAGISLHQVTLSNMFAGLLLSLMCLSVTAVPEQVL